MRDAGFTLIEVIVVLVVMVIAVGVVAPAFLPSPSEQAQPQLGRLLREARGAAVSRGETVYVRLGSSGEWVLEGAASLTGGAIARGSLGDYAGPAATIVVSPVGTCAFDVRSTAAWTVVTLDPLTCELVGP